MDSYTVNPGSLPNPGWYPDNRDSSLVRWWDGYQWTGYAQPKPNTKMRSRDLWIVNCVLWAVLWTVVGIITVVFLPVFIPLAIASLLMIMLPVGVKD